MFQFLMGLVCRIVFYTCLCACVIFSGNIKDSYYRDYIGDAVVRVMNIQKTGGGTGFHVEAESGRVYILTNAHVCAANTDGKLIIERNGQQMLRKIVKVYPQHDLCLVESLPEPEGVLEIANNLNLGEDVILIGHPGLRNLTLSHGEFIGQDIIQMVDRNIKLKEDCDGRWVTNPFKPNISINGSCLQSIIASAISTIAYGGNSGSPVVNKYGNVVGVLFVVSNQPTDSHMVPLNNIQDFLRGF